MRIFVPFSLLPTPYSLFPLVYSKLDRSCLLAKFKPTRSCSLA
ncbi:MULTISPECIES: hypothetical protein [Moorena]|nr:MULTISPECIES: hypothetical protein [Moorena]